MGDLHHWLREDGRTCTFVRFTRHLWSAKISVDVA